MEMGKASFSGATTKDLSAYVGRHQPFTTNQSMFGVPLGDRNRVEVFEYGVSIYEERDSVDKYSKYTK